MKTYETWQVVKALTEHEKWKGFSPETDSQFAAIMENSSGDISQILGGGMSPAEFVADTDVPTRYITESGAWRLYDEHGNEVTDYV